MTLVMPKSTAPATAHLSVRGCLVILLCVLVLVQVLGVPVTMITALMPSTIPEVSISLLGAFIISSLLCTSISECFSMLPPMPEFRLSHAWRLDIEGSSIPDLQVLALSVFHPPLT